MGINSTDTAYNFGQIGSGFTDENAAVTPPTGKVIVAITFLEDTTLSALVADTDVPDTAYFSHTTAVPRGLTIYGRWTGFTAGANSTTGGIIFYFGH